MSKRCIVNFIVTNSKEHPEEGESDRFEWVHKPTKTRVWISNETYGLQVSVGPSFSTAASLFGGRVTILSVLGLEMWRWRVWKAYLNWLYRRY